MERCLAGSHYGTAIVVGFGITVFCDTAEAADPSSAATVEVDTKSNRMVPPGERRTKSLVTRDTPASQPTDAHPNPRALGRC